MANGSKTELQSRLREAMEVENINMDEYVFQLELEEERENDYGIKGIDLLIKFYGHKHHFGYNVAGVSANVPDSTQIVCKCRRCRRCHCRR